MKTLLLIACLLLSFSPSYADDNTYQEHALTLLAGYPIVSDETNLQPSGLDVCDGKLLFVSDKHDHAIFELLLEPDIARTKTFLDLRNIPEPPKSSFPVNERLTRKAGELSGYSGGFDWEGLTCDKQGNFYLVSEYFFAVLKVTSDGHSKWVSPSFYNEGRAKGLFEKMNAYGEGITIVEDKIVVAIEREPRGLIQIKDEQIQRIQVESGAVYSEPGLSFDYAGMDVWNNQVYLLERNHLKLCPAVDLGSDSSSSALKCFHYRSTHEQWGFDSPPYGTAEGLAIDGDTIWLIFDNNQKGRLVDPNDRRPVLLSLTFPDSSL